jgi:U3 small nucleolar RNA-associated protein 25
MSSVEAPEMRALFNNSLKNVAGKVKVDKRWSPIDIPDGVKPVSLILPLLSILLTLLFA